MASERFSANLTVGLLLIKNNKVLLMRRCNTGYMDGRYAFEEVGIRINEEDLQYVCMVRRGDNDNYINFFLKADKFEGEPEIIEKDKCDDLIWCDINSIPDNTIVAEKRAIYNYLNGISFDEYGFERHKEEQNLNGVDEER